MVDVKVTHGEVNIREAEGNGIELMANCCLIVKAICTAFTEDIKDAKERKRMLSDMIRKVATVLIEVEDENYFL